jgi:hypothetical protein
VADELDELQKALIDAYCQDDSAPTAEVSPNGRRGHSRRRIELPLDDLAARVIGGTTNFDLRVLYDVSQTEVDEVQVQAAPLPGGNRAA